MRSLAVSLGLLCCFNFVSVGELVPAERITDWTPGSRVGVPGGIKQYLPGGANQRLTANFQDVTKPPYNADHTGATSALAAIQQAITDKGSIYIPPGTYLMNGELTINHAYDGMTVRGAGPDKTILLGASFRTGTEDAGFTMGATATQVVNTLVKDSTTVEVKDASFFSVGQLVMITWDDERTDADIMAGATPIVSVGGPISQYGVRRQVSRVTAKQGNTLTIFPGVYHAPSNEAAYVRAASLQLERVGLENFAMKNVGHTFPIFFVHAYGCWVSNVEVFGVKNYGIAFGESLQCDIRQCRVQDRATGTGTNGAGILMGASSGMLVEDNILKGVFPLIEVNSGTCGSVFAYNFFENLIDGLVYIAIDTNHNPHNSHNLYEGNSLPNIMSDGYFGGESEGTIFRNWVHGGSVQGISGGWTVALKRFSRNFSVVGNIMGQSGITQGFFSYGGPNLGNALWTGEAKPSAGDFWQDWKPSGTLTKRVNDTDGTVTLDAPTLALPNQYISFGWETGEGGYRVITTTSTEGGGSAFNFSGGTGKPLPPVGTKVGLAMQAGGFQELDRDVEATTIDKGNYLYGAKGAEGSTTSLGGETLPGSLYTNKAALNARGVRWGDLAFPPFDPSAPEGAKFDNIPAGYRFLHNGQNPPGNSDSDPTPVAPTAPKNLRVQ